MRSVDALFSLAVAATTTITTVSAGHVAVGLSKFKPPKTSVTITRRSDGSSSINLEAFNNVTGGGYYSTFEVGTPPQNISFLLDTGSSDTWVNSKDADLCNSVSLQETNGYCMATFDPDASKTFSEVDEGGFDITYLDGRNIKGDYFNDTVTIQGMEIKQQQLGLALDSVRPTGIMGLGFRANVAATKEYATIIDNMVSQGLIDTAAFSLYLNDLDEDSGTILFGGIDKQKFIGTLATLPLLSDIQATSDNVTSYTVELKGFEVKATSKSDELDLGSLNAAAILDSGSTLCLLPDAQVEGIHDEFGVKSVQGIPFVDCAYRKNNDKGFSFAFKFDSKTISVPVSEMVIDAFSEYQDELMNDPAAKQLFDGWDGVCMFGISAASDYGVDSDEFALLGDTFLRSAYVVYDLKNEQLGIAQANTGADKSDIVDIQANSTSLPAVTGVPKATNSDSDDDDDDDSAAGHLVPAALSGLIMVATAVVLLL